VEPRAHTRGRRHDATSNPSRFSDRFSFLRVLVERIYSRSIKTLEDVDQSLGVSVIGIVPDFFEDERGPGRLHRWWRNDSRGAQPPGPEHLIVVTQPDSPPAQSFRLLAGNVELCVPSTTANGVILLVTSPRRCSGNSTIAANLAATFAKKQWRTLLLDAHVSSPAVHSVFDAPRDPGLIQILQRQISLAGILPRRNEPHTYLDIVTAGQGVENGHLLGSADFLSSTLKELTGYYKLIIIDGPPALDKRGLEPLVRLSDRVVLVLRPHKTALRDAEDAVQTVEDEGGSLCGAVLNRATLPRDWPVHVQAGP
jgi:Mrp family chromosome partitioning ATPase